MSCSGSDTNLYMRPAASSLRPNSQASPGNLSQRIVSLGPYVVLDDNVVSASWWSVRWREVMLLPSNVKDVIDLKLLEVWCSKYSACSMDTSSYSNVERRVTACGHLH